jgi:uncharacterized protein
VINVLWAVLLTILNAVFAATIVVGLPGTWLMLVATLLVTWLRWDSHLAAGQQLLSPTVLIVAAALALVGEVLEFVAGLYGSRRAGGSKWGALGALVGTLAGGLVGTLVIPLPIVGSLIGACGGAALGALAMELYVGRAFNAAMRSGVGAGVGRLGGTLAKLAVAVMMWLVLTIALFWPR